MKDLTKGKESRLILEFAIPMLLGNVFQLLYNVVDSIIVGKFIGKQALAAVGSSFPIIFTLISLVIGVGMGATIIIAQYFGAKEIDKIKRTIDTLLIFLFFASIIISVLGIFFSDDIFRLIKLPEDVLPLAKQYLNIYFGGIIMMFGFSGTSAILRGLGDSKTPLFFLVIATIINIILDIVFVVVLNMGIEGVAIATVISQAGAFFTAAIYLNKTHELINIGFRKFVFDRDIFRKSVRIGFPVGFQQAFVALSMIAMYWLVNPFGTSTVAAYSVVMRIDSFASMPAMNFAAALSTFVGQNLGANKINRVKTGFISTIKMTSIIVIIVTMSVVLFSEAIMKLFTSDEQVIFHGVQYLHIVSIFYISFSTMFIVGGVMRGAGDTLIPMFATLISLWIVRIPVSYFLGQEYGEKGVWWGLPAGWIAGLTLSYIYYLTGRWKNKAIVRYPKSTGHSNEAGVNNTKHSE